MQPGTVALWTAGRAGARAAVVAAIGLVGTAIGGCGEAPADFVVNVDNGGELAPALDFDEVVVVEEGETLDLLVTPSVPGVTVTAAQLPTNATFVDGLFSFRPDFDQAGIYRVGFSSTIEGVMVVRNVGIRVHNVIHMPATDTVRVDEAGTTQVALASDDPTGTIVRYRSSLDATPIPGASLDPRTGVLTFAPTFTHLDGHPNPTVVTITAEGVERDTGAPRTATTDVSFEVAEKTSFATEIQPQIFNQKCSFPGGCHGGAAPSAGLNLSDGLSYAAIIGIAPAGPACSGGVATESAQVAAGDPAMSLLYRKMTGEQSCGRRMPINCDTGGSLACTTDTENRKVRLWIEAGAPEN